MTAFLPLDAAASFPPSPAFLVPTPDPAAHVKRVVKAVLKARRIAVVCGAGISVQAGIPDFRSSEGLFQSLKKDHPTLSSGKDLFDAAVFSSEDTTSLFCQMIAQLSQLSEAAEPTAFHRFLRVLDDRRRLLRVYTQNIDALEEKSGLTFGVPELDVKRNKPRSKGKAPGPDAPPVEAPPADLAQPDEPSTSRLPSPPAETPKCIPLHGTLQSMHCVTCTHSYPLRDYIDSLVSGTPPPCPQCTALEETRLLIGKRSRGVGKLRPSVVLYNEDHKDGEEVGNVVRKDLMGSSKGKGRAGADLLLVVGTSLRVPGTKRIVREFSKAVRSRHAAMNAPAADSEPTVSAHGLVTPTSSPRRSPAEDEEPPVRTIYLNLDFPVPTREWEGVFDVWIRGDAQTFARMVHEELEKEEQAKEAARERKRKREEAAAENARLAEEREREGEGEEKKGKKRKEQTHSENDTDGEGQPKPVKKRKTGNPPLSPVSPPSKTEQQEKGKKPVSGTVRKPGSTLPTPPSSRDDPSRRDISRDVSERLIIKLPARAKPEVVISTLPPKVTYPVHERDPFSSPLSTSPVTPCDSPSKLSKAGSMTTPASSPLSTPPSSCRAAPDSPYDMSRLSSSLSQIGSCPPPTPTKLPRLSTPQTPNRTMSAAMGCFSSPLSSEASPPPSPSPYKKRKVSKPSVSPAGFFLGNRPGTRTNYRFNGRSCGNEDKPIESLSDHEAHLSSPDNRWPESFERSTREIAA
ncbi:hypothetical protein V8D89_007837 [Ganoderma adspersum]